MKKMIVFILVFCGFAAYWNFVIYQKKEELVELAMPFYVACQTPAGCVLAPEGWKQEAAGYFKDRMQYNATKESFEIRWHIATDVHLVATAGKGKVINVERVVE